MEQAKKLALHKEFTQLVQSLLSETKPENDGDKFNACLQLCNFFARISGVSADDEMHRSDDIITGSGVAIMPVQAAKCLKEAIRSERFLLSVRQAITDKLEAGRTVNLLYAGSGPWGSIVLPLLHLFRPEQVQITLLDIHQQNINAINNVIDSLNLRAFFSHIQVADATLWRPTCSNKKFDIIVSETMNTMLNREPQVSIFAHLQQFLTKNGVLIPEEVRIGAWACAVKNGENAGGYTKLKDLFVLDRTSAQQIYKRGLTKVEGTFSLPKNFSTPCHLMFTTEIQVYKQYGLAERDCSLNTPVHLYNIASAPDAKISYEYELHKEPGWNFDYQTYASSVPVLEIGVKNKAGIMYLPRFWDKYRRITTEGFDHTLSQKEHVLDAKLMQLLGIELHDALSFISQELPDLDKFENWVKARQSDLKAEQITQFNKAIIDHVY